MSDYISREAAIEAACNYRVDVIETEYDRGYQTAVQDIAKELSCIPAADVREVKRGVWLGDYDGYADGNPVYDIWSCSNCGEIMEDWDREPTWRFCPNCGADMRGEADA